MSSEETPSEYTAMGSTFDTALRQHFEGDSEPDDEGFSQRVMAVLPPRASGRQRTWVEWAARAHWTALGLASCVVAALWPLGDARVDTAQMTAAYALFRAGRSAAIASAVRPCRRRSSGIG
jgi:hypothetical protein